MRALRALAGLLLTGAAGYAAAADVRSVGPGTVAVTVYRAPDREGGLDLDELAGFALITETRRVTLPAGDTTLRFEGVAGGIQAQSAIVTGLPEGVIEKNRDARLLSPTALVAASLHKTVELERTNPKTGVVERVRGTIESDAGNGVVFRSPAGVEALRCSGLPETFAFEPFAGAGAVPTLSVRVHSAAPLTRTVTLSYLAGGFDWSATYTATLAADGRTLDLGAWVTLANGNGESFPDAQAQVVAGRLNREADETPPADAGGPILAQCWPRGSTKDGTPLPSPPQWLAKPMMMRNMAAAPAGALQEMVLTARRKVSQEQLGDLKLYRVPERTTVAARQLKQVRLMDQYAVPVRQVYVVQVVQDEAQVFVSPAMRELRTRNTRANHLGLALPAGAVALFARAGAEPLLLQESALRDHAVDEELAIEAGVASDLDVRATTEERDVDAAGARILPLLPGIALRTVTQETARRLEITSALPREAAVEIGVELSGDERVVRADHPVHLKNGRPTVTLHVPANGRAVLRYATAQTVDRLVRPR